MQNLINENFENWEMVVSADCEGSFEYTISENGKIATISDLRETAAMKRLM